MCHKPCPSLLCLQILWVRNLDSVQRDGLSIPQCLWFQLGELSGGVFTPVSGFHWWVAGMPFGAVNQSTYAQASQSGLGFLTAWWSQGSQAAYGD